MKCIGIDYGTRRIGVAISDDDGRVAFPLAVVDVGTGAVSAIDEIIKKNKVQLVIVGESRTLAGEPNAVMEDIAQFKKDLAQLTGVPVEYEREFFTSALAARQFAPDERSRGANPQHKNLDASAAALILQSYLDRKNR